MPHPGFGEVDESRGDRRPEDSDSDSDNDNDDEGDSNSDKV